MNAPTYEIQSEGLSSTEYLSAVGRLADWVIEAGRELESTIEAYGRFVQSAGKEARRSFIEYSVEVLTLGVLWRARGGEATLPDGHRQRLIKEIVRERRGGSEKRRDTTTASLVQLRSTFHNVRHDPSLMEVQQLLNWLLASGEYDDEYKRLEGWGQWLSSIPEGSRYETLQFVGALAMLFEQKAQQILGKFTGQVDSFLSEELSRRPRREDTLQCSRRSVEYHLNMVGAELLNRAWRKDFLRCRRHVVVLPGCARTYQDERCKAKVGTHELECAHCTVGCAVSMGTRVAERSYGKAFAVIHGSDFSRFLQSSALSGGDVGVVGIACAPGLLGAGWRARDKGLPAQCVLLNASGCGHWLSIPRSTTFDTRELKRILDRAEHGVATSAPEQRDSAASS